MKFILHKENIRNEILFGETTRQLVDEVTEKIYSSLPQNKDFKKRTNTRRKNRYGKSIIFIRNPYGKNFDYLYKAITKK